MGGDTVGIELEGRIIMMVICSRDFAAAKAEKLNL